ncbi:MAG: hypothetical protein AB8H47_08260 [Bacteroidia bacterium]
MNWTAHWTYRMMIMLLATTMAFGSVGCRKKKELAEEMARQEAMAAKKVDIALKELAEISASVCGGFDHLDALDRQLAEIKARNIDNAEVMVAIRKAEYHLQQERERLERERATAEVAAAAAAAEAESKNVGPRVDQMFGAISSAGNEAIANAKIEELIGMFSSDRTPVLIVISQSGSSVDYDRPTTIRKYLNYIKDTGNNTNRVRNVVLDANGRIKELELIKQ